jgi:formyl-CoA transferase
VASDPEIDRRKMLMDSEFPTRGPIRVLGSPLKLSQADYPPGQMKRPPALGEHTAELLASIGIDSPALARLREDGIV